MAPPGKGGLGPCRNHKVLHLCRRLVALIELHGNGIGRDRGSSLNIMDFVLLEEHFNTWVGNHNASQKFGPWVLVSKTQARSILTVTYV